MKIELFKKPHFHQPKTAFVRLFHAKYAFVLCRPRFGERKFCVGIYSKCQWDGKVKEEEVQHKWDQNCYKSRFAVRNSKKVPDQLLVCGILEL